MSLGTISDYYIDDIIKGFSVCKICKSKLTNSRLSNLKRHLKTMHQVDVGSRRDVTICNMDINETFKQQKKKTIKIDISVSRLFRSYLGLVTEDNLPLTLLNSSNLRSIMDPICRSIQKTIGKKIQLNTHTCEKALHLVAEDVRKSIKEELQHKLLSIKVSASNIESDNTFIISAHFYNNDVFRMVTLGLAKLDAGRSSSKLTVEIIDNLRKYDIDLNQVVSITVDNETDVCLSNITTSFENSAVVPLEDLQISRCAARAAHLCCLDVANNKEIKEYLNICRNLTRFIDKSQICREFLNKISLPQLDCDSRWGSTYTMVHRLQSAKNILNDPAVGLKELVGKEFTISSSLWDFVDCFVEAMGPLQRTTIRYQEEDLNYSHIYAQWLKCKLSTECIMQKNTATDNCLKYKIATIVLDSMQHRQISNESLHACLFLDPRFHRMLKPIQKTGAICFLKKLWDKINHLNPGDSSIKVTNSTTTLTGDTEDDLLDKYLSESINPESAVDSVMSYSKIECLQLPFMKSDTDVLMFWEDKRYTDPELYQLSNICFAIPPTQLISNSVLSSLKLVIENNRDCTNETLENILLIKLNSSYLDKAVVGSLPLFENADEDQSSVNSYPLLVFEDSANNWPDLDENNVDMSDDEDNKPYARFNDHSDDSCNSSNAKEENGKNHSPKKPETSRKNSVETNEISVKVENCSNDEDAQLSSDESIQGFENSIAAHSSSDDDQSMEVSEEKERKHIKRSKKKSEFLCVECGKSFPNLSTYKNHTSRHKGNRKYLCPHCPKGFVCSSGLYTHVKRHTSVKPYVCSACARGFRTRYELKIHTYYHNGIKNFHCEHCELRFVTAEQQRRHMRKHTGEKPYQCKYCDRAFAQSNDCTKHLKTHLGVNVYQCELCPLRFPYDRDLRVHFATHKDDDEQTRARYLEARDVEERKIKTELGVSGSKP